jgi:NADH:ubiquinone oxidoreductase subunit E
LRDCARAGAAQNASDGHAEATRHDAHDGVKMMEMQKKQDAELDELIAEMNATTGEKRIDAIMAVLNKLVEQRKEMHAEMASHGSMQMPSASPAATMSPMEHRQ